MAAVTAATSSPYAYQRLPDTSAGVVGVRAGAPPPPPSSSGYGGISATARTAVGVREVPSAGEMQVHMYQWI
jgi:hypothetical protein